MILVEDGHLSLHMHEGKSINASISGLGMLLFLHNLKSLKKLNTVQNDIRFI